MMSQGRPLVVILLLAGVVYATPAKLFQQGNKAYAQQRYADAVKRYQEAVAESPASAEITYNLGNAQYRTGAFDEAMASYEQAALVAPTEVLRSQCWYNRGNCLVKSGDPLRASDPQAALRYCQQAIWSYRMALDGNPTFSDAAFNLEMSQRLAVTIEAEIHERQEKELQQNELIKYIRTKLMEFIERQRQLIETGTTGEPRKILERETRALAQVMKDSGLLDDIEMPDGTPIPGPLKETFGHTVKAADAMALPDPPTALVELIAALGAVPADPDQQDSESQDNDDSDMQYEESDEESDMYEEADPFGDFSEYEEIRGVPPPNKTERDILAEEIRNQERRKEKKPGQYKAVEKDW